RALRNSYGFALSERSLQVIRVGATGRRTVALTRLHDFTFTSPRPTIGSFRPVSGAEGSTVFVYGKFLTGATTVAFNGVPATFSVTEDNVITAIVPSGATSGPLSVTTPSGT